MDCYRLAAFAVARSGFRSAAVAVSTAGPESLAADSALAAAAAVPGLACAALPAPAFPEAAWPEPFAALSDPVPDALSSQCDLCRRSHCCWTCAAPSASRVEAQEKLHPCGSSNRWEKKLQFCARKCGRR